MMIILLTLFMIIVYYLLVIWHRTRFNTRKVNRTRSIYFSSDFSVFFCLCYLFTFFLFFFIYLRLLNLFVVQKKVLNLYFIFAEINFYFSDSLLSLLAFEFLLLMLIYLLHLCNFYIFFFAKHQYLKFHYYFLFRNKKIANLIQRSNYFDLFLNNFFGSTFRYKLFYLILRYGFKLYIILVFFIDMIFYAGEISLSFLPYYSFYYFILGIYEFILNRFCYDFDLAILKKYYPEIKEPIRATKDDLIEYTVAFYLGYSNYKFVDCIFLYSPWLIQKNWLIVDTFRYEKNKDSFLFHTKIERIRPTYL